ncbi:DUF1428 domain-containing protein [Bdellovibrio svalbardensis]|uniref:Uncharacterized protein n=1 Tax=Bdellovibrio svalbardensis TaxID=2972972 RepID=A0ABT6DJA2_9BACT|nr:hypothetical protein [Bdellovibrio svalbardensis]MDG0815163.1 hypothetical protein [Bdellovibrio svalbardensis]
MREIAMALTNTHNIFKLMSKDPKMSKMNMEPSFIDPKRMVVGGFSLLVAVE